MVTVSLGAWLVIGAAEIVEGLLAGSTVEFVKGAVMLVILPPVVAVLRHRERQQRLALAELGQTQDRLRDMAAASSDWLWEMGPDLRFTHFVGVVPRVTPESIQALIGKTRLESAETSLAPEAWAAHADDLAQRRPFRDFVYPWKDDEGRLCHCRISGRPFFDDGGTFLGYRGNGSDVTTQVVAEQALAAAIADQHDKDAQFKALASNIPGVVFRSLIDDDWTEVFISDGIEQLTGYPASDFVDNRIRSCASVIHPDDRALCERVTQDAVANRRPYYLEYRVLHKDGSVRWASERTQPVYDDNGRPLYIDGVIFDITERKKAEAALAESHLELRRREAEFRSLLSNIPGTVYRCLNDNEWTPIFLSGDVEAVSGYTVQEFLTKRRRASRAWSMPTISSRSTWRARMRLRNEHPSRSSIASPTATARCAGSRIAGGASMARTAASSTSTAAFSTSPSASRRRPRSPRRSTTCAPASTSFAR